MPSVLAGQPFASGPQLLVSGCFWSGQATSPQGGVLVVVDREASGSIYIGFSGSLTYKSGAGYLTGGGLIGANDGDILPQRLEHLVAHERAADAIGIHVCVRDHEQPLMLVDRVHGCLYLGGVQSHLTNSNYYSIDSLNVKAQLL
jgi:hypothetical protein